jgi:transposase
MQQLILPAIPSGATEINGLTAIWRDELRWTYYLGCYPLYTHPPDDLQQFRFITSQLIDSNCCRQIDIINTFGVSKSNVARSLRKLRVEGPSAFFTKRIGHRNGKVFSPEVLEQAQQLLDQGWHRCDAAKELGIKSDTFRKAIYDGRLHEVKDKPVSQNLTTKSTRDKIDAEAACNMGTGCVNTIERSLAAFGMSEGAPVEFLPSADVPMGGVLCALPALLLNGLLDSSEQLLGQLKGYYRTAHILLLVAYMALCRIKTAEQLRSYSPGEFGNLLGLDRVPEVRCLRGKMADLSKDDHAEAWAAHLSKRWLAEDPDAAGTLYIDGHVRVYHGGLTKPPKRFVSRDRLCLRGTTDYWVNDAIGRPFFVVEKPIDSGLQKALKEDIVPRLLKDVPNQPTSQEFTTNPYLCRFIMVFDREGYSPKLMDEMWQQHRIACITYKKFCGKDNDWPIEMFSDVEVSMPNGELVTIALAEQGSLIGSGKKKIWVREIRKLTDSGHQTSLISTAYDLPHDALAARMFSRWCQENFFRYMMRHYAIDLIAEYGVDDFPDTEMVVNPTRRELTKKRNSINGKLKNRRARFTALNLSPKPEKDVRKHKQWEKKKSILLEEIEHFEHQLESIKKKMKEMPTHILWGELEEKDKFQRLRPERKQFLDTVRMVAYRAETALAAQLKSKTVDTPAARQILLDLFSTEADIIPDKEKKILLVRVHGASRPVVNRVLEDLFVTLNKTEMIYPGTEMQLRYELGVKTG